MNLEEFEDAPLFKEVEGFPDYLISEYGVVWDTRQNKELKWIKNNTFNCVNMYNHAGKKELVKIHQAVAKTYLAKPKGATNIVLHKDLNRDNNHYTNLEWKIKRGPYKKTKTRYVTGKSKIISTEGSGTNDSSINYPSYIRRDNLLIRHRSMMYRCYNSSEYNYKKYSAYGLVGVTVCEEWHDYANYARWFIKNAIPSWVVDKDFMNIYNKSASSYNPENCVFISKKLNAFISSLTKGHGAKKGVSPFKECNKFACSITIEGKSYWLSSNCYEDVVEQYNLLKELHLEKLVWEMEKEYSVLKSLYGDIPPLNQSLLLRLRQFSMEEFLRSQS